MTNQMQMTVDVRKNGLQWCRWCFLLRGIFPREVSMNWLIINFKIQTKTNALIYQFSEMWSIIQETRYHRSMEREISMSTLSVYIERNSITKNTRVFSFSCEPSNWIIGNGLRNNIYHYFILLCCIARYFFFHINYLCNKIWSSIDQRKPGPLGILSIKHSSRSQYTTVSSDDW